jgi:hypothetical protein
VGREFRSPKGTPFWEARVLIHGTEEKFLRLSEKMLHSSFISPAWLLGLCYAQDCPRHRKTCPQELAPGA